MALVANEDAGQTQAGVAVTVNVLANDTLDGAPVLLSDLVGVPVILQQPMSGSATVNVDGSITYTPAPGFVGVVEIPYQISTPDGACAVGQGYPNQPLSLSVFPAWWANLIEGDLIEVYPEDESWTVQYRFTDGIAAWEAVYNTPPFESDMEVTIAYYPDKQAPVTQCIHFTWTGV